MVPLASDPPGAHQVDGHSSWAHGEYLQVTEDDPGVGRR